MFTVFWPKIWTKELNVFLFVDQQHIAGFQNQRILLYMNHKQRIDLENEKNPREGN